MSAIAAWAGPVLDRDRFERALHGMAWRGSERAEVADPPGALLGCSRMDWEFSDAHAGPLSVFRDGPLLVAADASLYYQAALRGALGLDPAEPATPSRLIALAYRRWGREGVTRLEGDFSFVLWDADRHTLVAARDFAGFRPLFWAPLWAGLAVASTARALLDLGAATDLDRAVLAATCGGLHRSAGPETVYRSIQAVPAAHTLIWTPDEGSVLQRHWAPPRWGRQPELPFDEAAHTLRGLIAEAALERSAPEGPTSCPLSGGWDSTAVFVIGSERFRQDSPERRLAPVSISYPEGDPGREDETIQRTLTHWNTTTRWLDVDEIPLFDDLEERVARQDLPFIHMYEPWNRALARGARADGATIQFNGYGGDQLFQVSNVYVGELVRRGHLLRAWREWQSKGEASHKEFVRLGVLPLLPGSLYRLLTVLRRGHPLHRYLDRWIPTWFDPEMLVRERIREREEARLPSAYPGGPAEQEWNWFLQDPFFPMVSNRVADFALEEGVESRAPLYDRRIVEFGATRPWTDLSLGKETKRLLRAACRGLAPEDVLAPRPYRTGVTSAYADRQIRRAFPGLLARLLARPLLLEELGIIRAEQFREACSPYLGDRGGMNTKSVMGVFYTMQTELWLRSHHGGAAA